MKKILALVLGLTSITANAHMFYPDEYTMLKSGGSESMVITHLRTNEDSYFKFTLNDIPLGDAQLVFAGDTVDFPIIVPHGLIQNDTVVLCAANVSSTETLQKKVCLSIKVK